MNHCQWGCEQGGSVAPFSVLWTHLLLVCKLNRASPKNVNVNGRFNVRNLWQSYFRPMGPPFTSLSPDETSMIKCLAQGHKTDSNPRGLRPAPMTQEWLQFAKVFHLQSHIVCEDIDRVCIGKAVFPFNTWEGLSARLIGQPLKVPWQGQTCFWKARATLRDTKGPCPLPLLFEWVTFSQYMQ